MGSALRRGAARLAPVRPGPALPGLPPGAEPRAARPGARSRRPPLPSPRLALHRLVLALGRAGLRDPLLPGAHAADPAGAPPDVRGGGSEPPGLHATDAPRDGPRHRLGLPAAPPQGLAGGLRPGLPALHGVVRSPPAQPELRAQPRELVRAEPPHRGLRRDLRRVAPSPLDLAQVLRRLEARAPQARVRGRPDGGGPRRRRSARARPPTPSRASVRRCGSTTARSRGTTASPTVRSTTATSAASSAKTPPTAAASGPPPSCGSAAASCAAAWPAGRGSTSSRSTGSWAR
jgi:hypothetical protein